MCINTSLRYPFDQVSQVSKSICVSAWSEQEQECEHLATCLQKGGGRTGQRVST